METQRLEAVTRMTEGEIEIVKCGDETIVCHYDAPSVTLYGDVQHLAVFNVTLTDPDRFPDHLLYRSYVVTLWQEPGNDPFYQTSIKAVVCPVKSQRRIEAPKMWWSMPLMSKMNLLPDNSTAELSEDMLEAIANRAAKEMVLGACAPVHPVTTAWSSAHSSLV